MSIFCLMQRTPRFDINSISAAVKIKSMLLDQGHEAPNWQQRLTRVDVGILGHTISQPCCSARDVRAVAVAICGWRLPVQREAL